MMGVCDSAEGLSCLQAEGLCLSELPSWKLLSPHIPPYSAGSGGGRSLIRVGGNGRSK